VAVVVGVFGATAVFIDPRRQVDGVVFERFFGQIGVDQGGVAAQAVVVEDGREAVAVGDLETVAGPALVLVVACDQFEAGLS
jgi:hypothetical protein